MSLPAWNRKAPSRAAIAATLSALTVFGASSVATADVTRNAYQQPSFGYGAQSQPPAPYGPAFGYAPQPVAPQGYAQPVAPQLPGYGLPPQAPGFGLPPGYGEAVAPGFPVPGAPGAGFGPYGGGFPDYGFSSQWGHFAPSEPNYAPHERAGSKAPAPVEAPAPAPASAKASTKPSPATATTSSDYSYEISPLSNPTYVGSSTQLGSAPATYADPYQSIINQQSTTTGYQAVTPSYTQQYDSSASYAAPAPAPAQPDYSNYVPAPEYNVTPSFNAAPAPTQSYTSAPNYTTAAPTPSYTTAAPAPSYTTAAPAPSYTTAAPAPNYAAAPAPNYTVAAPAPQQAPLNTGSYEYQSTPSYEPAPADYYDLNASAAAAAVAAQPTYEVAAYAPPQPVARRGGHFVQVGAFLDQARAARLVNKLGASGQQAFIVPAQVRGRLYHRVRIGGGSKRDARVIRDQVRELGFYEARVVKG